MEQELLDFLTTYINLTDIRNQVDYNPTLLTVVDPNDSSRELLLIVSVYEPTFDKIPYNVLWLVSDTESIHYQKLFRRVSDGPSADFKATWDLINTYADIWTADQFYQPVRQDLRDHGITSLSGFIGPASIAQQGIALLSVDDADGVAVSNTDPRNTNARYPNEHEHPDYPRTMFKVNDVQYGRFDRSLPIEPGKIPMLTQLNPSNPLEWGVVWRFPVFDDLVKIDRSLLSIEIIGPDSVDEQSETDYTVQATYADGNTQTVTPSRFFGNRNEITSVNGQTLRTFNTIQAEQVTLAAEYTENNVFREITKTVDIVLGVQIDSLRIQGPQSVNENSSAVYSFIVTLTDGTEEAIEPYQVTVDNFNLVGFNTQGVLSTDNAIDGDKDVVLTAKYLRDGIDLEATLQITVVDLTPYPVSIQILGPQSLTEGETGTYSARVTMNTGQILDVVPTSFTSSDTDSSTWTESSQELVVSGLTDDSYTDLTATFVEYSRQVTTTIRVGFVNLPAVLQQVTIVSPSQVQANASGSVTMPNFVLNEQYDDGSGGDIPHGTKYVLRHVAPGELFDGRDARAGVTNSDTSFNTTNTDFEYNIAIANLDQVAPGAATAPHPFVILAPRPLGIEAAQSLNSFNGEARPGGRERIRYEVRLPGATTRFNWDGDPTSFLDPTFDVENGDYSTLSTSRIFYVQLPVDDRGITVTSSEYTGLDNITYRYVDVLFPSDLGNESFTFTFKLVYVKQITLTDGSTEYATAVLEKSYDYVGA